jgi:nitroreductase
MDMNSVIDAIKSRRAIRNFEDKPVPDSGMAGSFILAYILYFVMAMLMYRDIAVQAKA